MNVYFPGWRRCQGFDGPCDCTEDVSARTCRTQYADQYRNTQPVLCEACARAYNAHWDEMWRDYYSDRL